MLLAIALGICEEASNTPNQQQRGKPTNYIQQHNVKKNYVHTTGGYSSADLLVLMLLMRELFALSALELFVDVGFCARTAACKKLRIHGTHCSKELHTAASADADLLVLALLLRGCC